MSACTPCHLSPSHSTSPQSGEGEDQALFLGAFEAATRTMGPGVRACIWVRGCPMRCRGCATPEFLEFPEGHPGLSLRVHSTRGLAQDKLRASAAKQSRDVREMAGIASVVGLPRNDTVPVSALCALLDAAIAQHGITGVSFSGGEPFAQAHALAVVAQYARTRGLSTLSWSGFARQHLEGSRAPDGSSEFLGQLDVLIDGPFVARRANDDPLRGSSNQRIHLLTERYGPEDFDESHVEVRIHPDGRVVTTGVMDYGATDAILALLGVR